MAKNLIPQIAQMLGVELGEEFKIKGDKDFEDKTFYLTIRGLKAKLDQYPNKELPAMAALDSLLFGDTEIVKMPWKPSEGQTVYSFYARGISSVLEVIRFVWVGSVVSHQALVKAGWVYPTREEAEAALPKVAAGMGVQYVL